MSELVTDTKFYADQKEEWGPGRRTVMLAFARGAQLSDNDIALMYNMKHKTVSARRCELWRLGFVEPVGMKKINRQRGQLWAATPAGLRQTDRLTGRKPVTQYKVGNVDLSQIECRVLNTLAGQWDVCDKFRAKVDLYSELASRFYGFPVDKSKPAERGTGKQLELSCGYGAGGPTIVRTARAGTYGPSVYLTDEQGIAARDLYRGTHPFVTALWERGGQILWSLLDGHSFDWGYPGQGQTHCMRVHDHRIFHVDTGLWLDYSSLQRVKLDDGQEIWRHRVANGYRKTYGARLIENVVQWLARLVISEAAVRVKYQLGYRIPLTVHDNIYTLIPANKGDPAEQLERIRQEVARTVPWLEACPIDAEAELGDALA